MTRLDSTKIPNLLNHLFDGKAPKTAGVRRSGPAVAALMLVGAGVGWSGTAEASGFSTNRFGGDLGNVTADNTQALYFNPAGLADRDPNDVVKKFEVHIFADANIALRQVSYTHAASKYDIPEPADAKGANTGSANLFNVLAVPTLAANFKIKDFAVAAGVFFPFGGQESWSTNDNFASSKKYPGPVDGVQRWHQINGTIRSMYISLGAAYDILDRVSIGAAFNLVKSDAQTVRARTPDSTNDLAIEGRSLLDVSNWSGAFSVGVLAEVVPRSLWFGASYQSQPGVSGPMVLKGTLTNNFSGSVTPAPAKMFQTLPPVYQFGIRSRPADKWEVRINGTVTDWSVFKNQCIIDASATSCTVNPNGSATKGETPQPAQVLTRNWSAAFGARAGASYWVKPTVELFGSLGFDSNAIPDSTMEPTFVDFNAISPAIGGKFTVAKVLAIAASYTHYFYIPRDTTGLATGPTLAAPSTVPDSGGKYSSILGVFDVNVEASF